MKHLLFIISCSNGCLTGIKLPENRFRGLVISLIFPGRRRQRILIAARGKIPITCMIGRPDCPSKANLMKWQKM
jgi:hypothetical protein